MGKDEKAKSQRRVAPTEVPQVDPRLGNYIEGYKSQPMSFPRWAVWGFAITMLATIVFVILLVMNGLTSKYLLWCMVSFPIAMVFLLLMFLYSDHVGSGSSGLTYNYIFTDGFMVEKRAYDESQTSRQIIFFDEVSSLDNYYVSIYGQKGGTNQRLDFKVLGKDNETLFELESYDVQPVNRISVMAIINSWVEFRSKQMMVVFREKGEVVFENIKMKRYEFLVNDEDYMQGALYANISSMFVTFYPADPEQSQYYNKLKNPSGAWRISINQLKNKDLFIRVFSEIYRDRLR